MIFVSLNTSTLKIHGSQGNPQETINQGDYEKAREENERKVCAYFSRQKSRNMHIFRKARGHFGKDSKENRELILSAVSNKYYVGRDKFNKEYFYKIIRGGKYSRCQVWVYVRDCIIVDAGINFSPLSEVEIMRTVKR